MKQKITQGLQWLRTKDPVPWIIIFYIVGFIGLLFPSSRPYFIDLVPATLLLSGLLVLIYHGPVSFRDAGKFLLVFAVGYLVELAGVKSGLIFGEYTYGASLGLKVLDTPLIIGLNWFMLVYGSSVLVQGFTGEIYYKSVLAAVAMVAYDFVLEPAAIALDMWSWDLVKVPLQNFIAWLLLAFVLNLFAAYTNMVRPGNRVAARLFMVQFGFFLAIYIALMLGKIWEF